jgi:hypothetical protein
LHCLDAFSFIFGAVVYGHDALQAMIEDLFYDVRRYAKVGRAGDEGTPQIVRTESGINRLALAPATNPGLHARVRRTAGVRAASCSLTRAAVCFDSATQ